MNFSSETTIESIIVGLKSHGNFKESPGGGETFSPSIPGSWLVIFCDEINIPKQDAYGTQEVISFLRQIVEKNGFWNSNGNWVTFCNVQIIGACNPPSDSGRFSLDPRFTRHCQVMYIDYPTRNSLETIYGALGEATLRGSPQIASHSAELTDAMLKVYSFCQSTFQFHSHQHYVFSPRELTRWIRGINEILKQDQEFDLAGLVRIWAHESLRIFQDRLVTACEKKRFWDYLLGTAAESFPSVDLTVALHEPILFSNYLSRQYRTVDRVALRGSLSAKLKSYYEEEDQKEIILFDDAIDHILKIDRIFRQSQGHMLLIGITGYGKKTLSKFVAWMNGASFFEPSFSSRYTLSDFDEDLKRILIRCGSQEEKMCLYLDSSKVCDLAFLERINTLLANAELPGLFEGDEYKSLMKACQDRCQKRGFKVSTASEVYDWFTGQIARNLHVIFSMAQSDLTSDRAGASPALYNRCVINWIGDWDSQAIINFIENMLETIDFSHGYSFPPNIKPEYSQFSHQDLTLPQAIADAFLYIHRSIQNIVKEASSNGVSEFIVTPTQYQEFAKRFVEMYTSKRKEIENRQRHLIGGLSHLERTFVEVDSLKVELSEKKSILESKTAQANEKLKIMVERQQEAEMQRAKSFEIQAVVTEKNRQINERKLKAQLELEEVEPAVEEAQQSVRSINRKHLTELKSMANPPAVIKLTMESVCIMLGHQVEQWKSVQSILRRDDFISSIVNYDTKSISAATLQEIETNYLSDTSFTFESANRASKACGPLLKWVLAQVKYASILEMVGPLKTEIQKLETEGLTLGEKLLSINRAIEDLESQISTFKSEYAALIGEVQMLQNELKTVTEKVQRSISILDNLKDEQVRWKEAKDQFSVEMKTLVGNVLISSAFLSYCGILDQQSRSVVVDSWKQRLKYLNIGFTSNLRVESFAFNFEFKERWEEIGLPTDEMCMQNALMMLDYVRYPFVIDPSGQAFEFTKEFFGASKVISTSLRDPLFLKSLESAVRFGSTLLIQDAEELDSVIFPILNQEIRRLGGRTLCKIGNKDVDFSLSFKLLLFSKTVPKFTGVLCSKTNIVNFTVTHSSLTSQFLHKITLAERPDIEEKHRDVVRLQGEYQRRLHHLEKSLLQVLSDSSGCILENDSVLENLERLKTEVQEVDKKAAQADEVVIALADVTEKFEPLAEKLATVYFQLDRMKAIDYLYQFSLETFTISLDNSILKYSNLKAPYEKLEDIILSDIYIMVASGLCHEDSIIFGLLMAQAKCGFDPESTKEWEHFLAKRNKTINVKSLQSIPNWTQAQNLSNNDEFMKSNDPESYLSGPNGKSWTPMQKLLILQALRPDRILQAVDLYLDLVIAEWRRRLHSKSRIAHKIEHNEMNKLFKPYLIISGKGYDCSHNIESMALKEGKPMLSIALGSDESSKEVIKAIEKSKTTGAWVIVKNAHLDIQWLQSFEILMRNIKDPKLPVFITMEKSDSISKTLLLSSTVAFYERPVGLHHNLSHSLNSISPQMLVTGPIEKHRIFFHLCWLHSVILERLRYVPVGWSKAYDFNDGDIEMTILVVNNLFDKLASSRSNISPKEIPWMAIRSMVCENIYGGKIDEKHDQLLLLALAEKYLNPSIFETGYDIYTGNTFKKCKRMEQYLEVLGSTTIEGRPLVLDLFENCNQIIEERYGIFY